MLADQVDCFRAVLVALSVHLEMMALVLGTAAEHLRLAITALVEVISLAQWPIT
jgi:hypothetical protein